ncbi:FkbM family methyltransferase [Sulfolobus acidocaldarius]|uniref:FkbM family methyltransferase n=1 Tax=Sulfolobus acidocaldarius TaxID=2285 RepID=UPI000AA5B90D|nr:FkbM family methyltransferase [Sulfolobus acidocaldarius]
MYSPTIKRLIELLRQYKKTYKNWYSVMIDIFRSKDRVKCAFKYGEVIELTRLEAILLSGLDVKKLTDDEVTFSFLGKNLILRGWKDGFPGDAFNDYRKADVREKKVLDIGAAIGDSPIYFSLMGAKSVVAVEPDPKKVKYMKVNLELNDIRNVIVVDKALSTVDNEREVRLNTLLEKFGPFDIAKIDCEGCERRVISDIKGIPEIIIEWDFEYRSLAEKLREEGYEVKVEKHARDLGMIYARFKR